METKEMKKTSVDSFIGLYDLHSQLFINVINGISEKDANNRLNTKANHPSWLAGSLVHERYEMANMLGTNLQSTHNDLFKNFQGIKDGVVYPVLNEYKSDWEKITPILKEALLGVSEEKLEEVIEMPGMKFTVFDMVTMLIHREPYCIGQIALYRRLLGYEAMKYPF
ncbi:MAG TPA: DinB family protein [Cytophagales bacterium]|nr:DinB family protein [Cytophagales bacterium]